MIMPPPEFFPPRRKTKSEIELEKLQERGLKFWNALARFQPSKKKRKK